MSARPTSSRLNVALGVLAAVVLGAYPVLVWFGLSSGSPRSVALVLVAAVAPAAVIRLRRSSRSHVRGLAMLPLVTVAALAIAALLDSSEGMLAVPVMINAVLLVTFAVTLRRGAMPMIERFARLQQPDLSPAQCTWCRLWTAIWCAFFVANGGTALALAAWAPLDWWALYNGLIAYGVMGALFAIEYLLRRRRFHHLPADRGAHE
ncbi:MAG: hypothetical protein KDC98_00300 [Planctomycetes bacterium]|nr:hypothetical protein [Planctomycetota bacterium]